MCPMSPFPSIHLLYSGLALENFSSENTQKAVTQRMNPRSFSSSKFFSCYLSSISLRILYILPFLLLYSHTAIAQAFSPLIRLPTDELYRNASTMSTTVVLNIEDFGAKGDGIDATQSLREVWKLACSSPVKAKIVIPEGKSYLIQPIDFGGPCRSKLTFRISGFIRAPEDPAIRDGHSVPRWLYFHRVKFLKVEGGGIIDGMGWQWPNLSCKINASNPCVQSPTALTFHRCKNLKVRNITINIAQQMLLAFTECTRVVVSGVVAIDPTVSPNTKGIHISSSTLVQVRHVFINTGNDCISIVGNSSRIQVSYVACGSGHGISIGSLGKNSSGNSVQDVVVSTSVFFNTNSGARIKTWQGDCGSVKQIKFEHLWMKNVTNPIIIDQYYCDSPGTCQNQTSAVRIENVSFDGIFGISSNEAAITFACSDSYPCKRLHLRNIQLETSNGTAAKSFCWKAYGTNSGAVYPPSCLSSGDIIIRYGVQKNSTAPLISAL